VNSLQEGFFVADHDGAVIEMNNAFIELLGYPNEGLPYRWPYPWLVDERLRVKISRWFAAAEALSTRRRFGIVTAASRG